MKRILRLKCAAVLLAMVFYIPQVSAQTLKQKQNFTAKYDQARLNVLKQDFSVKQQARKALAIEMAQKNNWELFRMNQDGTIDELMDVSPDGFPVYYSVYNVDAARSTRANHLNIGGSLGLSLDGQNMTAHVWDGGPTRVTHQEFDGPGGNNRVSINDGVTGLNGNSFHAQHVTGTIVASGFVSAAKGMAPQASALTHDWNNDLAEATGEAASGMLISNHSYGYRASLVPDWYFGAYIDESRDWDNLMYNSPFYLMVVAAGNDGNDNSSNAAPLGGNSAYDKLTGHSTAKNNLVVANGQDANVNADGSFNSVIINSSSSEGPTDDYRIKPDITGNGTGVYSTYDNSDAAYNSISGTSMASPNVAGTLLLLQQHYNNVNGSFMRAATLKGLALHTADDAGISGPDVIYGWGLLNAKSAAEAISSNGVSSIVDELTLSPGQTYTISVDADGSNPLMASISWTDPAGVANTGATNNTTPVLVNDLDIRVIQGGTTFFPYRLTGINSNGQGDNNVDPFERVDVSGASGSYTIEVTHKGSLSGGSQDYSLVVTGITSAPVACTATTPTGVSSSSVGTTSANISWNSVPGATYDVRYRVSGTSTWTNETASSASINLTGLSSETEYEVQVRSKCPDNSTSAYSSSIFFTTSSSNCTGGISSYPYVESFENTLGLWTQSSADDLNWTINSGGTPSSGTGPSGASDGTYYIYMEVSGSGYPTKRAILNSPCIDLTGESSASLTFDYQMTGTAVGTISLELSNDNGNTWGAIWTRTGNQGTAWLEASLDLSAYAGSGILLRFNGVSGSSWSGDIAIDNFNLSGGSGADTQPPTAPANLTSTNVTETSLTLTWTASSDNVGVVGYDVYEGSSLLGTVGGTSANITGLTAGSSYSFRVTAKDAADNVSPFSNTHNVTTPSSGISCSTTLSAPYSEGFESSFGAWVNASGDDFDWARRSGGTPSSNTGPGSAVEGSTYIYMEASSPNYPSKSTTIESPCFDLSGESSATFSFNYHMYGATSMGGLTLQISIDGTNWSTIWSRSGNQGNSWLSADVNLDAYAGGTFKLRFTGTTASTWQGDIAIDNISLTSGSLNALTLTIVLDNYPEETSWEIREGSTVLASGGTYGSQPDGSTVVENINLTDGCYDFIIYDTYGDGICCSYGSGSYTLSDGSSTLASGGAFGSSETTNFCLNGATSTNYAVSSVVEGAPITMDIYPNPVSDGIINVYTNRTGISFSITNLSGQKVQSGLLDDGKINVSSLNTGVYLLEMKDGHKSIIEKIVIE